MSKIPLEVLILTKQIDQFEWEIQTEAITVDDEKKLVKRIQENLEKLHEYANKYQEHEEVGREVKKLTNQLRRKLRKAEDAHQKMLAAVIKSDDLHKKFVDAVMKLRDARAKRIGFQREVEKHTRALEHWQKVAQTEAKKGQKPPSAKTTNLKVNIQTITTPEPRPEPDNINSSEGDTK